MDRLESVTTDGIPRRGFLKGAGGAAALAGPASRPSRTG
ncbi:twin-arginine translocation signal domain-containing protein (plasmid) [Skermanella mucosa]|nr:twin-arginine translocation signal domain-containing protein [Skermanella mucosa]UEM25322.1 twin-arginine translocation signal domain-containing protein [Skermanella mucosa]